MTDKQPSKNNHKSNDEKDLAHVDEANDVIGTDLARINEQLPTPRGTRQSAQTNLLSGTKRNAINQETMNMNDIEDCLKDDIDEGDGDFDQQTTNKLFKIEKLIEQNKLSKRERRLLQNRKSALKCRLKKQSELEGMKGVVEQLN